MGLCRYKTFRLQQIMSYRIIWIQFEWSYAVLSMNFIFILNAYICIAQNDSIERLLTRNVAA